MGLKFVQWPHHSAPKKTTAVPLLFVNVNSSKLEVVSSTGSDTFDWQFAEGIVPKTARMKIDTNIFCLFPTIFFIKEEHNSLIRIKN